MFPIMSQLSVSNNIACRHGYRYEHSFAFYPLMPVIAGVLARNCFAFFDGMFGVFGWRIAGGGEGEAVEKNLVVVMGLLVSVAAFMAMAVLMYVHSMPNINTGFGL